MNERGDHTSDGDGDDDSERSEDPRGLTMSSERGRTGLFLALTCGFLICLCCASAAFAALVAGGFWLAD
ncbi:MAG: hypothetical protein ACRDXX_08065 [Stackebrandtia sp.]